MDFKTEREIWNKYNPKIKDSVLQNFLKKMKQVDPKFDMEKYFQKSKQPMANFQSAYPNADIGKFMEESDDGIINNVIYYKNTGFKVFRDGINPPFNDEIKAALGQLSSSSFPKSPLFSNYKYPILTNKPQATIDSEFDMYGSEDKKFRAKFRNSFVDTFPTFSNSKQAKKMVGRPGYELLAAAIKFHLLVRHRRVRNFFIRKIVKNVLKFHVYFTVRIILNEMKVVLPGESIFKINQNRYSKI